MQRRYVKPALIARLGECTPQAIYRAIREDRLEARRVGSRYLIEVSEAARYLDLPVAEVFPAGHSAPSAAGSRENKGAAPSSKLKLFEAP